MGVVPALEAYDSVCPGFCPDLSRAEQLGFRPAVPLEPEVGSARSWEGGSIGFPIGEWGPVRLTGKWGEWPQTQSQTTQSLTPPESAHTSTPWPRQLAPQHGLSSAGWDEREFRG